jgi:hypothetical protein
MHGIIILPVVFYGYETWSLTLREENNTERLSDNRVRRRVSGHKRQEGIAGWKKSHKSKGKVVPVLN